MIALAAALALAAAPTFSATSARSADETRRCIADDYLGRGAYMTAIEHGRGWRLNFGLPSGGNYYVEVQPSPTGATVEVYGFRLVAKAILPSISACARLSDPGSAP